MLVSLLLILALERGQAQNVNPNDNNRKFDPDSASATEDCNLPPYQDVKNSFRPDPAMCVEPDPTLTIEDARKLAVDYAPYLYFHPLEQYTLTDVDLAFADPSAGKVYFNRGYYNSQIPPNVFADDINQTAMLFSTRDLVLGLNNLQYFFTHNDSFPNGTLYTHDFFDPPGYLKGSGYDEENRTKAPIYYRVFDSGNNTWTFNYEFYYAFNGHSNLGVLSSYNGTETYTPFQLRPLGQHEGDWEGITVMVCKSNQTSQPLAMTYRQHGWTEITNCLEGECHFFKDTFHPVGFVALNSHATFNTYTRNMIYAEVKVPFFFNLQGFLIVDRTEFRDENGKYKHFVPDESNVVRLNELSEIELGVPPESEYWQAWGGHFGDITKPTVNLSDPYCLAHDQQSFIECPTEKEEPVFTLVMQFMGVYPVDESDQTIQQAAGSISGVVRNFFTSTGNAPPGPQTKPYYNEWDVASNAPIWNFLDPNITQEEYCKRLREIPDSTRLPVESNTPNVMGNIMGILIVSVIIPLFVAIWYLWPRIRGTAFQDLIKFDEDGNLLEPDRAAWWKVHRPAIMFTFFTAVGIAGVFTFCFGYVPMFDLLDEIMASETWNFITTMLMTLGIIVLVLDTFLFAATWILTRSLWKQIWIAYYETIGDKENAEKEMNTFFAKNFATKHVVFVIFLSLLFLSLMITAVCVIVAIVVVGFSYGFNQICETTVGSLNGVCLDLSFFGVEEIQCGPDFKKFCGDWADAAHAGVLWGAFLILWAHFFYIAAGGESYYEQVSTYSRLIANRWEGESLLVKKSIDHTVVEDTNSTRELSSIIEEPVIGNGVTEEPVIDSGVQAPSAVSTKGVDRSYMERGFSSGL